MADELHTEEEYDLVAIGETLAAFIRDGSPERYVLTAVGAESNVAVGMAQLGCRTRWVSRLGEDELGRFVHDDVARYGVDTQVDWDTENPTGLLLKEIGAARTHVRYYRSQSAARHLTEARATSLGRARWIHVTGITPALSPSAAGLVEAILSRRSGHAGRVSFDINYRPALWQDPAAAAHALIPLARQADVVFIGDDEAEALLGTSALDEVASHLLSSDDQELVIKRGAGAASAVTLAGHVSEPARAAAVVDVTGAGDAFAAGYLAGWCRGWEARDRLRLGHYLAARVVAVRGDIAVDPDSEDLPDAAATMSEPDMSSRAEMRE
jgi:2-dehydro-3-deoxygluconokinase